MDNNLKQLLSALNANSVKYVIIGGYAVAIHAQPRATKDLDVFIESSPENGRATYKALAEFGAPLQAFTVEDFSTPNVAARFGNPPICFDVLQHVSGVDFAEVFANSIEVLIDGEITARYISAEDLVKNKLASGRPQDLADAAAVLQKKRAKEKAAAKTKPNP